MSTIICPSCKTPAPPGAIFCDNCGYDLRTVTAVDERPIQPVQPTYVAPNVGSSEIICPNCGHANISGSVFCENCGTKLTPPPPKPAQPASPQASPPVVPPALAETVVGEAAPAKPGSPGLESIPGKLLISSQNVSIPIPPGNRSVILGREDPVSGVFPDIDLDPHGGHDAGVGRRHAQIVIQNGEVMIEDLDSVNGTAVNKQKLQPRNPYPIKPGDEIRLGKMILIYMAN